MRAAVIFLLALLFQAQTTYAGTVNLLQNAGAEDGAAAPDIWLSLASSSAEVAFNWEETVVNSGKRSVGMWQQTVPVIPGQLYLLTGNVAFQGVTQ